MAVQHAAHHVISIRPSWHERIGKNLHVFPLLPKGFSVWDGEKNLYIIHCHTHVVCNHSVYDRKNYWQAQFNPTVEENFYFQTTILGECKYLVSGSESVSFKLFHQIGRIIASYYNRSMKIANKIHCHIHVVHLTSQYMTIKNIRQISVYWIIRYSPSTVAQPENRPTGHTATRHKANWFPILSDLAEEQILHLILANRPRSDS